ncbi:MAG TPA: surface-adhesin E family protein [Burkholderiales bacterium]|nr:surface-adhesin E family protein [Burkholderiales bacterium]
MKVLFLFAAIAITAISVSAHAEKWMEIDKDATATYYVDADSLSRDAEIVSLTKKAVYRVSLWPVQLPDSATVKETAGVIEENCRNKHHRVISMDMFNLFGERIWSSGKMKRIWESVEPNSNGERTHEFACSWVSG